MSTEFINAFRVFEERRKELKVLMKEYRWGWTEGLPTMEITRVCDSEERYNINDYADSMLDNMKVEKTDEKHLTLVKVTPAALGLTEASIPDQVLNAAEKKGLKPCPPWVGPQYRLDCNDDERTFIGTEPVTQSGSVLGVFVVSHSNDGHYLFGSDVRHSWGRFLEWVFVVPE